jgi:hypothetical protein
MEREWRSVIAGVSLLCTAATLDFPESPARPHSRLSSPASLRRHGKLHDVVQAPKCRSQARKAGKPCSTPAAGLAARKRTGAWRPGSSRQRLPAPPHPSLVSDLDGPTAREDGTYIAVDLRRANAPARRHIDADRGEASNMTREASTHAARNPKPFDNASIEVGAYAGIASAAIMALVADARRDTLAPAGRR